jgi:DnaJ-class molecular chaperone
MDKNKNYYNILKVDFNFTKKEIKSSYRQLSKEYHPDKTNGDDTAFKEISIAYNVLSNDEERAKYDKDSKHGRDYNEESELLNFEFSNNNLTNKEYRDTFNKFKKKDLVDILLKINDPFNEQDTFKIKYDRYVTCKKCDGIGMDYDNNDSVFDCDACEATGEFMNNVCFGCGGKGVISINQCTGCNGQKIQEIEQKVILKSKDFKDGKYIKKYFGNASKIQIGKVGNLYIELK